jgi:hypothetical protein
MRVRLQNDGKITECYNEAAECYSKTIKYYEYRGCFRRLYRGDV